MDRAKRPLSVQIFATDLDHEAIEAARAGVYPEGIARRCASATAGAASSPRSGRRYRVKKDIREMVIFAAQNVLKDPPFTKLDLLVCRNLLIYLQRRGPGTGALALPLRPQARRPALPRHRREHRRPERPLRRGRQEMEDLHAQRAGRSRAAAGAVPGGLPRREAGPSAAARRPAAPPGCSSRSCSKRPS